MELNTKKEDTGLLKKVAMATRSKSHTEIFVTSLVGTYMESFTFMSLVISEMSTDDDDDRGQAMTMAYRTFSSDELITSLIVSRGRCFY